MWALMDKLVPQLPGVVTFAYDLCFRHVIVRWKGLFEKYSFSIKLEPFFLVLLWKDKKTLFRAPKQPWKYKNMY